MFESKKNSILALSHYKPQKKIIYTLLAYQHLVSSLEGESYSCNYVIPLHALIVLMSPRNLDALLFVFPLFPIKSASQQMVNDHVSRCDIAN